MNSESYIRTVKGFLHDAVYSVYLIYLTNLNADIYLDFGRHIWELENSSDLIYVTIVKMRVLYIKLIKKQKKYYLQEQELLPKELYNGNDRPFLTSLSYVVTHED